MGYVCEQCVVDLFSVVRTQRERHQEVAWRHLFREDHRGVPREERQRSFPKRAAFALVTAAENLPGRDLGAQPCELCGQWTLGRPALYLVHYI